MSRDHFNPRLWLRDGLRAIPTAKWRFKKQGAALKARFRQWLYAPSAAEKAAHQRRLRETREHLQAAHADLTTPTGVGCDPWLLTKTQCPAPNIQTSAIVPPLRVAPPSLTSNPQ